MAARASTGGADAAPQPPGDRQNRFDELSVEERELVSRLGDVDTALLAELRPVIESRADHIIDRFEDHLRQAAAPRRLLSDGEDVERLKGAQREYLLSLSEGVAGREYAQPRFRLGRVHERIGLEPRWFVGFHGICLESLLPSVADRFPDDPQRALRAAAALSKLLLLDMEVVLEAYYAQRRRREMQRAAQLAAVGELAASIAHEVRNPLAGMKGALEILRGELAVKPSNLEVVEELLAQIGRLENLVRDLLTFGRPSSVSVQAFDLHDLLDRLLKQYKEDADAANITIHRIYGPGTGRITADPQQMEQVFLNLIHNAVQAMEDGGTLTVTTQLNRDGVIVSFQDTGKGIPADDLQRIFQPFFTTKHRGSGLGLPIVRKIVEAHGGTIELGSTAGEGTRAIIKLPTSEGDR